MFGCKKEHNNQPINPNAYYPNYDPGPYTMDKYYHDSIGTFDVKDTIYIICPTNTSIAKTISYGPIIWAGLEYCPLNFYLEGPYITYSGEFTITTDSTANLFVQKKKNGDPNSNHFLYQTNFTYKKVN